MSAPLSAEARALIDRPNFAHLATLMADGSPHSVPVWVGREGDRRGMYASGIAERAQYAPRSPGRAVHRGPPQSVRGRPTPRPRGGAPSRLRPQDHGSRIAQVHRKPFPLRSPEGRVALVIEADKVRYTKLPFVHTPPRP